MKIKLDVSDAGKDLISRLLNKNPKKRLGAKGGMEEILSHPFFQGLDFEKLK